jgi:hypothetical protein
MAQDSLAVKSETSVKSIPPSKTYKVIPHYFTLDLALSEYFTQLDTLTTRNFQYRGLSKNEINTGNVGSTTYRLVFNPLNQVRNDYTRLAFQPDKAVYEGRFKKPITYAEYQTGSAQEQLFTVFHGQTFRNQRTLLVGVDKVNSKGFYRNQAVNNTHFYSRFTGSNKQKKYTYSIGYYYHKQLHQLNGGLVRDEDFTDNQLDFSNKALLDIQLANARQSLKYHKAAFKHSYALTSDSAPHQFKLIQEVTFLSQSRLYYDTLLSSTFYDYFNVNDNVTHDSLNYRQWGTRLGGNYRNDRIEAGAFIFPSVNQYKNLGMDTTVFDLEAEGKFNWSNKYVYAQLNGSYLLNDRYANNDYSIDGGLLYKYTDKIKIRMDWMARRDRPALDMLSYTANNIAWHSQFSKTEIYAATARIAYNKKPYKELDDMTNFQVEGLLRYTDIKNPIFFNLFREPQQVMGFAQVVQTGVSVDYENRKWHLKNESFYQYTGGYQVLPIPNWYSHLLVEYDFKAFKKKMELTLGTDIQYFSAFQAPKYDPVTNQFFISGTQTIGNYPFVDVFLKARIQRVKIAFTSSHVNQGLLGANYFYFPHYPANDRMFKIALSWLFLN